MQAWLANMRESQNMKEVLVYLKSDVGSTEKVGGFLTVGIVKLLNVVGLPLSFQ
jgi:hypothetical protein